MNPDNIFKKTLPYLALFFLSITVAGIHFIQNYAQSAKAETEGIAVTLTNITAPIKTNNAWQWRVDVTAKNHIGEQAVIAYTTSWCKETFGETGEEKGRICNSELTPNDFIQILTKDTKSIIVGNMNFEIFHTSVPCGRVYLEFEAFGGPIGAEVYDTGKGCSKETLTQLTTNNYNSEEDGTAQFDKLKRLFSFLFPFLGGKDIVNEPELPQNPSQPQPGQPGQPQPTNIPGQNPAPISGYGSPPNRPYYNPGIAVECYTSKRFNEVYGSADPGQCWVNTKRAVESSLTGINFLGKAIKVNGKTVGAFNAVDSDLASYKASGSLYNFTQGQYRFSSVGTYNFRCNVNASSSQNLCSNTCKLSAHAFGIAIDINPQTNANGSDTFDMPPEVVRAFENHGFRWGGRYKSVFGSKNDAMHFEYLEEICR